MYKVFTLLAFTENVKQFVFSAMEAGRMKIISSEYNQTWLPMFIQLCWHSLLKLQ